MPDAKVASPVIRALRYAPPEVVRAFEVSRREPVRIAPLDGLRGVAILLVLVHNTGTVSGELSSAGLRLWASLVNTGWVGVQLFFALSGFLITRILLDSTGADGYFRRFYMRRLLRIFPLYYVALAVVFLVAPHVGGLETLAERGSRSPLWYWTYLANWAQPFGGLVPSLGHFWSLAVEEQFYIVWPALVLVLRDRSLAILCTVMVLGALAARLAFFAIFEPTTAGSAAYYLTIARCDALAMGAAIALVVRHPRAMATAVRWGWRAVGATVVALAGMVLTQHGLSPFEFSIATIGQTMLGMLSAALVLLCVAPSTRGATARWQRAMSAAWLRSVGKYSYAMYVIHLPLNRLLRPRVARALASGSATIRLGGHVGHVFGIFALSYVLALVSWQLIEQPFLNLKRLFPMPTRSTPAAA